MHRLLPCSLSFFFPTILSRLFFLPAGKVVDAHTATDLVLRDGAVHLTSPLPACLGCSDLAAACLQAR
jgi:hypothetical protein